MTTNSTVSEPQWYKDAIIYELHIKAFADSNKDGIGDFKGLLNKLDYLVDLGATAIWLLPFYPSPLRDDGYDIKDYYRINPSYGNLQHFKKFMEEAHKRGLRVITELVLNHTSDQHPWFQKARKAKKGSPERDFYVWTDDPHQYKDARIIFQDYEGANWTWDAVAGQYFWHRFFSHQPDLNFDNPAVQEEVFRVIDFWLDMGVDGFRLDAVPYLFERNGTNCENLPETHQFLKQLRAHVDAHYSGRLLLAEANMWPEDSVAYFGEGDECHMNYHFPLMPRMFMSLKMEDRYPIVDIFEQTPEIPENCQWAMFLRNHDELTLEMVTDEERDYMYKMYAKDPKARINLGIRQRLAPLMENNRARIELINALLFSFPGTPVIYYGDEIGMGDNYYLGDRNGVRTPMQWSPDRNAGFSMANPQQLYLPLILDPEYHYEAVNVEVQQKNGSSLLWWMKRIIHMRKKHQALSRGNLVFVPCNNPKVLAFTRTYQDETILVVANLSRFAEVARLDLDEFSGSVPVEVFSQNKFPSILEHTPYQFTLNPNGYYWFRLNKEESFIASDKETPGVKVAKWRDLFTGKAVTKLENEVLIPYIKQRRWFGGKARTIQTLKIKETLPVGTKADAAHILIMEVSYNEGQPELYQLPVHYITGAGIKFMKDDYPQAVICPLHIGKEEAVLHDALYATSFQETLFQHLARRKKVNVEGGKLEFIARKGLVDYYKAFSDNLKSRILQVEQSNTSVLFGNNFFMKFYRKLDKEVNPDVEITRYLTEQARFPHTPKFMGAVERTYDSGGQMVLGMVQELVGSQGDAWGVMLESLKRYYEGILTDHPDEKVPVLSGTLMHPVAFEKLPGIIKELMGNISVEWARLLGVRTGEMHIALKGSPDDKAFAPEAFSLHYQRSLFSSLQGLIRNSFQVLSKSTHKLPEHVQELAKEVSSKQNQVLQQLKKIYSKKFNVYKIRTHGDYHLGQVLYTGKDFCILDFEGEPARSYSERRLKRSPLRDVAGMLRSFHYAAYGSLLHNDHFRDEDVEKLVPWAEYWYHYNSGYFFEAWQRTVQGEGFVPDDAGDLWTLMQTFLLEKAVYELGYELNNRPEWVGIPLRGIRKILKDAGA